MAATFEGQVMQQDFNYSTVQFMSVDIPGDVEQELGIKPKDRLLVKIPGAVFHVDTFGHPGDLAFSFPPEIGRTLNLRNKQKIQFEVEAAPPSKK